MVTITSLAESADVPYATAIRRVRELADMGYIDWEPRTGTGKTFALHPSKELLRKFDRYVNRMESLVQSGNLEEMLFAENAGRH